MDARNSKEWIKKNSDLTRHRNHYTELISPFSLQHFQKSKSAGVGAFYKASQDSETHIETNTAAG